MKFLVLVAVNLMLGCLWRSLSELNCLLRVLMCGNFSRHRTLWHKTASESPGEDDGSSLYIVCGSRTISRMRGRQWLRPARYIIWTIFGKSVSSLKSYRSSLRSITTTLMPKNKWNKKVLILSNVPYCVRPIPVMLLWIEIIIAVQSALLWYAFTFSVLFLYWLVQEPSSRVEARG